MLRFVQDRILRGQLNARIEFVFSNREAGEAEGSDQFFELVKEYGFTLTRLSSSKFRRARQGTFAAHRDEYDQQVMALLACFKPDVCVLAGYMLIVGDVMCRTYPLLNLHPALPDGPIGTWQEVVWELIESRATSTGAMMHLATEDVDRGPVVSYCTVPLIGGKFESLWDDLAQQDLSRLKAEEREVLPLFQLIRQAEYQREPYLVFETLRCVAEDKVLLRGGQVLGREGQPLKLTHSSGLCLDQEISRAMSDDGVAAIG